MAIRLQELIHKYEQGAGHRTLKFILAFIVLITVAVCYDLTAFRNLSTPEGMDAAQLARNICEGKGFTTDFIRPLSVYLIERKTRDAQAPGKSTGPPSTNQPPPAAIDVQQKLPHPDLANPPVYPILLAGALKLMPFAAPDLVAQQKRHEDFKIYKPDLWIALFNQLLFLLAVCMVFSLARKLFDEPVAWVSAAVFLGTDLFWRFSISGLSTILLIVIFLALISVLARMESTARESAANRGWLIMWAVIAGLLVGIGGLTRYAFACLIGPVAMWLTWLPVPPPGAIPTEGLGPSENGPSVLQPRRAVLALAAVGAFAMVMSPWLVRNLQLSGTPFGTAGFAVYQNTAQFSDSPLQRTLAPEFGRVTASDFWQKILINSREMIQSDFPKLGGSWVSALFLAGLLVPFRNPALGRLRLFLVICLGFLTLAQALARTSASAETPEINSENLLVVLAPLVLVFGIGLFFTLLQQFALQSQGARHFVLGIFLLLACAPFIFTLVSAHPSPIVYPPYYPPWIEEKAGLVNEGELIMTDIPWAVAWYGRRPSVWLSLKYQRRADQKTANDFSELNTRLRVRALYFTSKTLKSFETGSLLEWLRQDEDAALFSALRRRLIADQNREDKREEDLRLLVAFRERLLESANRQNTADTSWEQFILGTLLKNEVPTGFPLTRAPQGLVPEIFLTDSERIRSKTIQSSESSR